MIDLADLRRIRLRGGTRTHAVTPGPRRFTACGVPVKLTGPAGRNYDEPLRPAQPVTCRACQTAQAKS